MGRARIETSYDFIDLGASSGGSLVWAAKAFGGTGLGVDLSEEKAAAARATGHRMLVADARDIKLADGSVRFCTALDFLEHLPSIEDAGAVIQSAVRLARDFVFIALPNFDNEALLRQIKLKRYYTDWSGHSLHLRTTQLDEMLQATGHTARVFRYGEMFDTWDRSIIPLSAPRNSSFYDPGSFDPKPFQILPRKKIYQRTLAVLVKRPDLSINEILMQAVITLGYLQGMGDKRDRDSGS